jgi:serine phosphatase RsbU (regulator of sigma subunit)
MNLWSKIKTHKRKHPLSYRLLIYILLFSSYVALFATGFQLGSDYWRDVSLIEERMKQIENHSLASIETSVWEISREISREMLDIQLQSILDLPDIKYVKVQTSTGDVYSKGQQPEYYTFINRLFPPKRRMFQLDSSSSIHQKTHDLGTLEVVASLENVVQRLFDKTLIILATQAIKTFAVSLFILFIVQSLITRHLADIASYASQLDTKNSGIPFKLKRQSGYSKDELDQLANAINTMRETLIENERMKTELALKENERLKAELEVTRRLQKMLLPPESELNQITGLDIAGFMEPAEEIGGDYYDVLQHQRHILFGIGDVTGHGLESGMLVLMIQAAVRTLLENEEKDPVKFINSINRMIYQNAQGRMKVNKYLSLSLLEYQQSSQGESKGVLRVSGQHEEMIVVRNGNLELIDTSHLGSWIGLIDDITKRVKQIEVLLNVGDVVVLYTDGITEAANLKNDEYGIERLCQVVKQHWQKSVEDIKQIIIADVRQFIGTQKVFDDITLLVLKQK